MPEVSPEPSLPAAVWVRATLPLRFNMPTSSAAWSWALPLKESRALGA